MKIKILLFLVIVLTGIQNSNAQYDTTRNFQYNWRQFLRGLDLSQIPSGYLREYTTPNTDIQNYRGIKGDSSINLEKWEELYHELDRMAVDSFHRLIPFDSVINRASRLYQQGINPILTLDYDYHTFRDSSLELNLIDTSNGMLLDVAGRNMSPYVERKLYAVIPYSCVNEGRYMKIMVSPDLFFSNNPYSNNKNSGQPTGIKIVFNGVTYNLDFGTVYTIDLGIVTGPGSWVLGSIFTIMKNQDDVGKIMGQLDIKIGIEKSGFDIPGRVLQQADITSDLDYKNEKSEGTITTVFGKGNGSKCVRRPFIFVEGIDFGYRYAQNYQSFSFGKWNSLGFIDIYEGREHNITDPAKHGQPLPQFAKGKEFFDKLYELGYDVIYLDFKNGADYIQRSAMCLIKLINEINAKKCTNEEIVICGASMGGQIMRYALAYMEKNNMKHCVRNSIYFDSPNKGANIPIGLQHLITYFADHDPDTLYIQFRDITSRMLNRPATQQLLMRHYAGKDSKEHDERKSFMDEMNQLGKYARFIRKVAVPNGSTFAEWTGILNGDPLVEIDIPYAIYTGNQYKNIGQAILYYSGLYFVYTGLNGDFVTSGKCYGTNGLSTDNFLLFTGDAQGSDNEKKVYGSSTDPNIDGCPGGTSDVLSQFNKSVKTVVGKLDLLKSFRNISSFISTNSSLDLNSDDFYMSVKDYILTDEPQANLYPFDAYYSHRVNSRHVEITGPDYHSKGNMAWCINEVERTRNILVNLPGKVEYINIYNQPATASVKSFNYNTHFRKILNSVSIYNGGTVYINHGGNPYYSIGNDLYNNTTATLSGKEMVVRTSDCGSDIDIYSGGKLELGDVNYSSNTAILYIRSGSNLHIRKNGELVVNNNCKIVIEKGAVLSIDEGALVTLSGNNAILQINGELKLESGTQFYISDGILQLGDENPGMSDIIFSMDNTNRLQFDGNNNEVRLRIASDNVPYLNQKTYLTFNNSTMQFGPNASFKTDGPIEANNTNFESMTGVTKGNGLIFTDQVSSDIVINSCSFSNLRMAIDMRNCPNIQNMVTEYCMFSGCYTGLKYKEITPVLKYCSFTGCGVAVDAEDMPTSAEIYYTSFENCIHALHIKSNTATDILVSWCSFKNSNNLFYAPSGYTPMLTFRCSDFNNSTQDIEQYYLNMSNNLDQPVYYYNSGLVNSLHGGRNQMIDIDFYLNHAGGVNISDGENDFKSTQGGNIIFNGSILDNTQNTQLDINNNYFEYFSPKIFQLSYIDNAGVSRSIKQFKGNINASANGGCSGSGGKDGDGLFPVLQQKEKPVSIFPNPASNMLNILLSSNNPVSYSILEMGGKKWAGGSFVPSGNQYTIPLDGIPNGIYILLLTDENGEIIRKKFSVIK